MMAKYNYKIILTSLIIFTITLNLNAYSGDEPTKENRSLYGHKFYNEVDSFDLAAVGRYRDTGRIVKATKETSAAFMKMRMAAKKDGVSLVAISGFRTIEYQKGLFEKATKKYGSKEKAALWVAPPNHSEHHTGMALDIGDKKTRQCDVETCFETTPAFKWLSENAVKFNFYLSFPNDNGSVNYEAWHWRYINK